METVLIGGTGFIGRHVVQQLCDLGHKVTVLHRGKNQGRWPVGVQQIAADANNLDKHQEELRKLRPDVVVNFILSSGKQAELTMRTLRGVAKRVVVLSSTDVYRACGVLHRTESGDLQALPLTEESELRTQPAYSPEQMEMGKRIFSWMTDDYDKIPVERVVMSDPRLPGTILRLPMVYGPGDPLHRFLPVIKRIRDGRPRILFEESIASWRSPKGFVANVAQAIALAATSERANRRIYNIAEETALSELEWAQAIAREMNWHGEFVVLPCERIPPHLLNPGNYAQHWVASSERIRQELGFQERIKRTEALRTTIEWEIDHPPKEIPDALFNYAAEDAALA